MSQKRTMEDLEGRLQKLEDYVNTVKSRLSAIEDRLMEMERGFYAMKREEKETIDLSQVPVDTRKD